MQGKLVVGEELIGGTHALQAEVSGFHLWHLQVQSAEIPLWNARDMLPVSADSNDPADQ